MNKRLTDEQKDEQVIERCNPMKNVNQKTRQKHLDFIHANWPILAAESFKGFKKNGRGMLVVNEVDFVSKPKGVFVKFSCYYVAEGSQEFIAMGGRWPGDKEAGWVMAYNGETTILIGFPRTDGGISSYKIDGLGGGSPMAMYQRQMSKQN
jgi:hypothetical protein